MPDPWYQYLLCAFLGGFFGYLGSITATSNLEWKVLLSALATAILSCLFATLSPVIPYLAIVSLSVLVGWLACGFLEVAMSEVSLDRAVLKGLVDVLLMPPLVFVSLWAVWKVFVWVMAHNYTFISGVITLKPGAEEWVIRSVIALWVASATALRPTYRSLRKTVLSKRVRRW